jgi:hypothetical protein
MKGSTSRERLRRRADAVARLHKKHRGLTFAPVEHTDEELHRRLKYIGEHAAPFFAVSLSEDQKNVICTSVRTGRVRFVEPVDALWN